MTGLVELDARAVAESVRVVSGVGRGQLDLPTPCAGWTLERLLAHMAGQHAGFAAAASGEDTELPAWADRPVGDDPGGAYARAADEALTAFAAPGVLERTFLLPEVHPALRFPATTAIGFHLLDYAVHAWDVAAALGTSVDLDPDVLDAALAVASQVPVGDYRTAPGAPFAPPVPLPADAPPLHRLLASTGRSPHWRP